MIDSDWKLTLQTARRILGKGEQQSWASESWCAWTTFSSLESWLTYWHCGLPEEHELLETSVADGGTWSQPFPYRDIAHLIIPATFYWENLVDGAFQCGDKKQNLDRLSAELQVLGIPHRKTDLVLEFKFY